jgi:predicted nucleic acid-binding protein
VLFSAIYSSRGYSRDLLLKAAQGQVILVLSDLVIEEVRRNLAEHAPDTIEIFDFFLSLILFEVANPSRGEVHQAAQHIVLKDAPILAAAKMARADFLVTLDKKHLLGKPELVLIFGIPIVTPKDAMANLNH